MKQTIMLCMIIGSLSGIHAQNVITIFNKNSGEALESVFISSDEPRVYSMTNSNGEADFSSFQGSAKIVIRRIGFKSEQYDYQQIKNLNFRIGLVPNTTEFSDVVVSVSKWQQDNSNVASKVSIISSESVALQNPQTAADMLGTTGEVFIQKSQQGGGSPMIRGFATNRLLYSVDGIRMNNAIFRGGNLQNVISLDPFAIENTEVIFGPGSVIYGSDAIGAVMSFRTLTPQLSLNGSTLVSGNATTRVSTANNELTNHFHVKLGSRKWAMVSSISHNRYGDSRMGSRNGFSEYLRPWYVQRQDSLDRVVQNSDPLVQSPTGYTQTNLMQKIRFSPNRKWDFQYGFHLSETSNYARFDRLVELQSNGLPVSAVWEYGPQKWVMNNMAVLYKNSNKLFDNMSLKLAQQYFEESRIDRRFNHHRLRTQLEQVTALSFNLDFEKKADKHQYFYGLEYVMNDVKSTGKAIDIRDNSEMLVPDRYPQSQWSSYAAYLSYHYHATEKLILSANARYNVYDVQSDFTRHLSFYPFDFTASSLRNAATTGSVSLVYKPTRSTKISFSAGTAFRAPNVDDIGKIFDFTNGSVTVPNANLKAEYAYNGEINISQIMRDWLKVDVSGYYTYLDKALVRREFQVNGQDSILYDGEMSRVFAIQNAAFATVYGFHAGLEIKLPNGFGVYSKYSYQLGQEEMDNGEISNSRHATPAFGLTRLTYISGKLNLQVYSVYSAGVSYDKLNEEERQKPFIYAKDANGNPFSPRWITFNFKAMYQLSQNFSVSAGVENLTDQQYRPYSSGIVAPGRNFILSIRANF